MHWPYFSFLVRRLVKGILWLHSWGCWSLRLLEMWDSNLCEGDNSYLSTEGALREYQSFQPPRFQIHVLIKLVCTPRPWQNSECWIRSWWTSIFDLCQSTCNGRCVMETWKMQTNCWTWWIRIQWWRRCLSPPDRRSLCLHARDFFFFCRNFAETWNQPKGIPWRVNPCYFKGATWIYCTPGGGTPNNVRVFIFRAILGHNAYGNTMQCGALHMPPLFA